MGFGGPIGINQIAVWEAIEHYQIENKIDCFEKVIKACNKEIELIQKKIEKDHPKGNK